MSRGRSQSSPTSTKRRTPGARDYHLRRSKCSHGFRDAVCGRRNAESGKCMSSDSEFTGSRHRVVSSGRVVGRRVSKCLGPVNLC